MKCAIKIAGALVALTIASVAQAQNYPAREVKMIVPFPAGGPSDIVARIAADGMSKHLGHNILIENVGGAGGTLGATRASEAAPDGYTLFAASMGTIIAAPTFYPNLKYDSTKDFEPIGMSANAPAAVSINKNIPVKDLKEFVAWAKQKGPEAKQAFGGVGGTSHMACLLFNQVAGIKPTMVAYRGMGPGMNDLMGGHVDIACEQAIVMAAAIQGEKV
ncbi:MAG TPA: tripartite tricarboxylate transporter substrate-binding protein, partial [Pseudolabrys sp.]|nr:tripartite tricarboxylate transporter substrate-binding protein [Pseudolabrys sp.]